MYNLHLLNYNNYYNRQVKRFDTISEYDNSGALIKVINNVNFDVNDGIRAEVIISYQNALNTPNYCLICQGDNFTRWFVISQNKTRGMQYKLSLRRDVIADFYDDVIQRSPCLIRKGYVSNNSNFVFAYEGQEYNQIKDEEILLKDTSKLSWIIGFVANNVDVKTNPVEGKTRSGASYYRTYNTLQDFDYYQYIDGNTKLKHTRNLSMSDIYISFKSGVKAYTTDLSSNYKMAFETVFNKNGKGKPSWYSLDPAYSTYSVDEYTGVIGTAQELPFGQYINSYSKYNNTYEITSSGMNREIIKSYSDAIAKDGILTFNSANAPVLEELGLTEGQNKNKYMKSFDNKIIRVGTNTDNYKYYRITYHDGTYEHINIHPASNTWLKVSGYYPSPAAIASYAAGHTVSPYNQYYETRPGRSYPNVEDIKLLADIAESYITIEEVAQEAIRATIPDKDNRTHLTDAPYDMFFMPYIGDTTTYKIGGTTYNINSQANLDMAQAIGEALSSGVYDIQIVPYAPIQDVIKSDGTIDFTNYNTTPYTNVNGNALGHIVWANISEAEFDLTDDTYKLTPADFKKDVNLKKYRLCSPDSSAAYDFSPAMNGGIEKWHVSINYKPYGSYIKVQPEFKRLYGNALYNGKSDIRGLIYQSKASITQLTDAWQSYVTENSNYQNIFNTQIKTEQKQYDIQNKAAWDTMFARSYNINPIKAGLQAWGNTREQQMNEQLQNLALSSERQIFNYQLGSIQARPDTVSTVTSITVDNRYFPFIEIYKCSTEDESAFDNKIKYTGMTIMATGYIKDYLNTNDETFIQASLIRLELKTSEDNSDFDLAKEIATELDRGVYI